MSSTTRQAPARMLVITATLPACCAREGRVLTGRSESDRVLCSPGTGCGGETGETSVTEPLGDVRTFRLSPGVVAPLREQLSHVATQTIDAIMAEVPAYAEPFAGDLGPKVERAVRAALGAFL